MFLLLQPYNLVDPPLDIIPDLSSGFTPEIFLAIEYGHKAALV